jgi:gliding motility-associated-like protein
VSSCAPPLLTNFIAPKDSLHPYPLSYVWEFGDGSTSTLANPSHTYITKNPYNVKLTVTDSVGCTSDTIKQKFIVIDTLRANFSMNFNALRCNPLRVTLANTSNLPGLVLAWNLDNGNAPNLVTNVTTTYPNAGNYNIRLIASTANGCSDTIYKPLTVVQKPNINFDLSDSTKCSPPLTVNFTNNSTFTDSYLWSFGDGATSTSTNANHIYANTGIYDVKLVGTSNNGCKDSLELKQIIQIGLGQAFINTNTISGCKSLSVDFEYDKFGPGIVDNILWDFGDGTTSTSSSPNHIYTNRGTYSVKLSLFLKDGCPPIFADKTIYVGNNIASTGVVTPLVGCVNKDLFTYSVRNPNSNYQYIWLFGDGGQAVSDTAIHSYDDPNLYQVKLITVDNFCYDTINVSKVDIRGPEANFSSVRDCFNKRKYTFTNQSSNYTSFYWILPDGSKPTTNAVTYTFPSSGVFNITIVAFNSVVGCTDSVTKKINIKQQTANIKIEPSSGCAPLNVTFTDLNTGGIRERYWDFGNNQIDTAKIATTTYLNKGIYTVTLIVKLANGCIDTSYATNAITVQQPDAGFYADPPGGCAPLQLNLIDTSKSDFGIITEYFWQIDDLNSNNDKNSSFLAVKNDTFNILHVVKDNLGCIDSIQKNIITIKPTAIFSVSKRNICTNVGLVFNNFSIGQGLTYLWDFGDGKTDTAKTPTHIYSNQGVYDIKLTIFSEGGCMSELIRPQYITVSDLTYDFTADKRFKSCPSLITNFSVIPDTIDYRVLNWNLGNGSISNDTNKTPATIYTQGGKYDVNLYLEDIRGCKDTIFKKEYIVIDGPSGTFDFFPKSGCLPLEVTFNTVNNNVIRKIWDFGDGNIFIDTTTNNTFKYTYTKPGVIIPSLILIGDENCQVEPLKDDSILISSLDVSFTNTLPLQCDSTIIDFNQQLNLSNFDTLIKNHWDFGDGFFIDDITNYSKEYNVDKTTIFNVKINVETKLGCKDSFDTNIKIFASPTVTARSSNIICINEFAQLEASGTENFIWSPNTYLNNSNIANPKSTAIQTIDYQVIGYDTILCPDTTSVNVKVLQGLSVIASPDTAICIGFSAPLSVDSDSTTNNTTNFVWQPASTLDTNRGKNVIATPITTTIYNVTASSGLCKPVTIPVKVEVNKNPNVDAGKNQYIIKGSSTELLATSTQAIDFEWSPTNTLSCSNCIDPIATPQEKTTYYVVATDPNGCKVTDSVIIEVFEACEGDIVVVPNSFTPNGDGKNDVLYVRGLLVSKINLFRIFDRWGELVFESKDINDGWNGLFKGVQAKSDVYVYYVEALCINGETTIKKGNVTLIR